MFGNLVQIELIRLFRNKALKISSIVGAIMLLFFAVVEDFLISLGALNAEVLKDITPYTFKAILFIASFSSIMSIVVPVNVVYTTCDYQRSRLAVNIEGAIRSRFKLCMSEVIGIALFIVMLNLLLFPGLLLLYISHPADIVFIINNNWSDILSMYAFSCLNNIYICIIVYLISKFTSRAPLALALSLIVSIIGVILTGIASIMVNELVPVDKPGSSAIVDAIMYMLLSVPVVVLSIALAVRYRKADRI